MGNDPDTIELNISRQTLIGALAVVAVVGMAFAMFLGASSDPEDAASITGDMVAVDSISTEFDNNHLHGIDYDHENDRLYLASHYGLYALLDTDGEELYHVGESIDDHMGFTMHPDEPEVLYRSGHPRTGGNLGVELSEDGGHTWDRIFSGVGRETVDFHSMTINDADPDLLAGMFRGNLYVTEDGGETWHIAEADGLPEQGPCWHVPCLTGDTENPDVLYAGTMEGLYRSDDRGETWTQVTSDMVLSVGVHPDNSNVMLGYSQEGIVRSEDGGDNWDSRYGPQHFGPQEFVFGFAFNRENPDEVYAATVGDRVLYSEDGGESWTEISVTG